MRPGPGELSRLGGVFERAERRSSPRRQPVSFAYPFGGIDAGAAAVVSACGYNSGRGVSGVNDRKVLGETIPPLEGYVTAAEQNGGGWVQLVFHHLCDQCDAYSITPANFGALLDWLQPRAAAGTTVMTTAEVIGGAVQPPVQP